MGGCQQGRLESVSAVLRAVGVDRLEALDADPAACKRLLDMAAGHISPGVMGELLAQVPALGAMFNTLLRGLVEMAVAGDATRQERWRAAQQALAQGQLDGEQQLKLFDLLTKADQADGERQERLGRSLLWSFGAMVLSCTLMALAVAYAAPRQGQAGPAA
jgi:hypothetical protein